jgi:hypothetical protein
MKIALTVLTFLSLSHVASAAEPRLEDYLPQSVSIPQGARVFKDGSTMLYDNTGRRGNVTPDERQRPDDTPLINFGVGGPAVVKDWQRPAASPAVIAAWVEKCKPVSYEDAEHIRRQKYAAPDCDLTDPR